MKSNIYKKFTLRIAVGLVALLIFLLAIGAGADSGLPLGPQTPQTTELSSPSPLESTPPPPPEYLPGDVNGNWKTDTGDATLLLRSIVGLPISSQYLPILPIGDMNCNNKTDTGDATLVLRIVVGLPIPNCGN